MSEMIERVSKAVYKAASEWLERCDWPAAQWDDVPIDVMARAAIEAMREPTNEMLQAGWDETDEYTDVGPAYRAMIDAALTTSRAPTNAPHKI